MSKILSAIFGFISKNPAFWISVIFVVFLSAFDFGQDLACWIFEEILTLITYILGALPINAGMFNPQQYVSSLPAEVVNVIVLIKMPQALGIIVAALVIRFALQLIPFVRLGS